VLQVVPNAHFGVASDLGGRTYQDDRCIAFSLHLPNGQKASVAAILDGHHGHHLSEMVVEQLPGVFVTTLADAEGDPTTSIAEMLETIIRSLDDMAFEAHASGRLFTGGTTLLIAVLAGNLLPSSIVLLATPP